MFCILGFLLLIAGGIDFDGNDVNTINTAWADEINGTENSDNITGTINQDTIRGFEGNYTLAGKEAGDDIVATTTTDIISCLFSC